MPWRSIEPQILLRFLREANAATWVAAPDGQITDVSEWTELTGQTADAAKGNGWLNAIHPDDVERVSAAWQTAVAHGSVYNSNYRLRCADGQYRWFNARGTPTFDESGDPQHWVGMMFAIPSQSRSTPNAQRDTMMPADHFEDISPSALRAARAMLGWSADELAQAAGLARSTLRRLEDEGPGTAHRGSVAKILAALAKKPLLFIGAEGLIYGVIDRSIDDRQTD